MNVCAMVRIEYLNLLEMMSKYTKCWFVERNISANEERKRTHYLTVNTLFKSQYLNLFPVSLIFDMFQNFFLVMFNIF